MEKMIKITALLVALTAVFSFSQKGISSQYSLGKCPNGSYVNSYGDIVCISQKKEYSCPNGSYVNSYGNTVCRPSSSNSGGATAICNDGTYSYSQSRRGTCSRHGGVARWL